MYAINIGRCQHAQHTISSESISLVQMSKQIHIYFFCFKFTEKANESEREKIKIKNGDRNVEREREKVDQQHPQCFDVSL